MNAPPSERRDSIPEKTFTRGRLRFIWDAIFGAVRLLARHVHNAYATFGILVMLGAAIAIAGTYGFAVLARHVSSGGTQAFDDTILAWLGAHRSDALESIMLEITALGTGSVVTMIVGIAGLFLWLNRHKHSALLLLVATLGGILLNNLLKMGFERPRPTVITWATSAHFYSFPSGHAMSATIVYSTVAYLAARLQRRHAARVAVLALAACIIVLICFSRLYLGVHYPSDVIAGVVIGLAWAGFCMAVLEAAQIYARRNAPELLTDERPAPPKEPDVPEPTPAETFR